MKKGNDEDKKDGKHRRRNRTDRSSNQNDEDNGESQEPNHLQRRRRGRSHSNDNTNDSDRRTNSHRTNTDQSMIRTTKSINTTKLVDNQDGGKVRSISQQGGSISTASITNLSSASSFGVVSGGALNPHGQRRRRSRKPPSRSLYNTQLQLLATMTGGSFIAFLFFFLNIFAFASLMMGLASVIMLMHTIYNYANFLLESGEGALFDFLPQNLQEYLTNTTIHDAMIDDSEFMENRWYLLYFIPGLSNEQRQALINRLPQRHRDMAYGSGGMARMFLPDSIFRMIAPPNARSYSSSTHHSSRSWIPAIMADAASSSSIQRIQNQSVDTNTSLTLPVIDEGNDEDSQSKNREEEDSVTMQDAMQNLIYTARAMITRSEETQHTRNPALDLNDLTMNHSPNNEANTVEMEVEFSTMDSDDESDLGIELDADDMVNGMNDGQLRRLARFVGLSSPIPVNASTPRIVPVTPSSPETPYTPIRPRIMDSAAQDDTSHTTNLSNTFQRVLNDLQEESDNEVESIAEQTIEEQQELEGDIIMDAIGTMINHYTSQAADTALSVTNSIVESMAPPIIRFGTRLSGISVIGLLGIYSSTMQRQFQIMGRSLGGGRSRRTRTEDRLFTGFALTLAFGTISAGSAYVARSITRSMMKSSKSNDDSKKPKDT
jgi:hypothetical protein